MSVRSWFFRGGGVRPPGALKYGIRAAALMALIACASADQSAGPDEALVLILSPREWSTVEGEFRLPVSVQVVNGQGRVIDASPQVTYVVSDTNIAVIVPGNILKTKAVGVISIVGTVGSSQGLLRDAIQVRINRLASIP